VKAVRHPIHDESDDQFVLRDDFNRGIAALKQFDLRYDILIFEKHLPQTIQFVDRHPDQVFILDHVAKPRIHDQLLSPWKENMRALARRPNVYCKISGMVTEADWQTWSNEDLSPYIETVLEVVHSEAAHVRVGLASCDSGVYLRTMDRHSSERDRSTNSHRKRMGPLADGDRSVRT
jgi:L-fuconolactonase